MSTSDELNDILVQRLERKGIKEIWIPGFLKTLATILRSQPQMNLEEVNRRLCLQGWTNLEIDEHTLQLIIANFDKNSLNKLENSQTVAC